MQDAIENCHYPELVGEQLRLELSFNFPLEHVTELIVLGERMSLVPVDKFDVVAKKHLKCIIFLSSIIIRIPLLKYRYRGSFPFDYVHTPDTFAKNNKQPSNMQGEHWIMIANFC